MRLKKNQQEEVRISKYPTPKNKQKQKIFFMSLASATAAKTHEMSDYMNCPVELTGQLGKMCEKQVHHVQQALSALLDCCTCFHKCLQMLSQIISLTVTAHCCVCFVLLGYRLVVCSSPVLHESVCCHTFLLLDFFLSSSCFLLPTFFVHRIQFYMNKALFLSLQLLWLNSEHIWKTHNETNITTIEMFLIV